MRTKILAILPLLVACGSSDPVSRACRELGNRCEASPADVDHCVKGARELPAEIVKEMNECTGKTDQCADLLVCWYSVGLEADRKGRLSRRTDDDRGPDRCRGFKKPVGDCTDATSRCDFNTDCPVGSKCNQEVERCFELTSTCVGTPCRSNSDCPAGERCNGESKSCYNAEASQRCMPCDDDADCGASRCVDDLCE